MKKNDEVILKIEDLTSDGEGIGKAEGFALFVKNTLPGDKVRAKIMKLKKSYGFARLVEILEPSTHRVEPCCSLAEKCGGCQLQHMSYSEQLKYKEKKIKNCMERIGGITNFRMEPILGMEDPYYYRNKAQFPVGRDKEGNIVMGFYAGRTHSIIDTSHCYIQAEINGKLLLIIRNFMEQYQVAPYNEAAHTGLVRHVLTRVGFATGQIMVCLIINGRKLPFAEQLIEQLREIDGMTSICINVNTQKSNVILGGEVLTLWGKDTITDCIGSISYEISPKSFYQVNSRQTKKLYDTVLQYAGLTGQEIVWDLYCGIGTISLFLARRAKMVYGVEIVADAVQDAKRNADRNHLDNVEFFCGAAEIVVPKKYEQSNGEMRADVIVIDPPRKGCDEALLRTIVDLEPKRIVYVSCDPATLARDLKYLVQMGYGVEKVRGCDMFGMSVHVETAVLLVRKP